MGYISVNESLKSAIHQAVDKFDITTDKSGTKMKRLIQYYDMDKAYYPLQLKIGELMQKQSLGFVSSNHTNLNDFFDDYRSDKSNLYAKSRKDMGKENGVIDSMHKITADYPIKWTGGKIGMILITFDSEKVYSVKGLFASRDNPNPRKIEIPGAKEVLMKYKK